jgi:hypothetical protein
LLTSARQAGSPPLERATVHAIAILDEIRDGLLGLERVSRLQPSGLTGAMLAFSQRRAWLVAQADTIARQLRAQLPLTKIALPSSKGRS